MRVVIYTRVSSQEQVTGYSLDAQQEECETWARAQGHQVVRTFVEPGRSARTDQRPEFQRMLRLVKLGIAEAVLIHKSDRIARNLLDWLVTRNELEKTGRRVLSVTEPFLNDDSPESRMVSGIIGSVNEFYSANLSREVRKGQGQKAKGGSFPGGRLPLGYTRDDDKQIILDPAYAEPLTSAFAEFATGAYTLEQWTQKAGLRNARGRPLLKQSWQKIFRNIFYIGQFVWDGSDFEGDHPPLTDPATFAAVQTILDETDSGGAKTRHFWLLAGLLWSGQYQAKMTGSLAAGKYAYYRAKGPGPEHSVKAEEIEARLVERLKTIRGTNRFAGDGLRLAMAVAPSIHHIWQQLPTDLDRRDLLRHVIERWGITVEPGGAISQIRLHPNFESPYPL